MNSLLAVPFVRWPDVMRVEAGGGGAYDRQIYDHELVYVTEGEGEIVLDGCSHVARADSLFLVGPRVFHSFLSPRQPQRLLGVHFDWELRADSARFASHRPASATPDVALFQPFQSIKGWDEERRPFP